MVDDQHVLRGSARRSLQQVSESTVTELLNSVNTLRNSQDSLKVQVSTLSTQVQEANQAAEERANDQTLENLIAAGRQDILLGQSRVESLLAQIIGKQNQALAAAEQAQAAVQAISLLQDKQAEALTAVTQATDRQLSAIKQASQQGLIDLDQALVLWKRARRDRETAYKQALLSNSPCSTASVENHDFEVPPPPPPCSARPPTPCATVATATRRIQQPGATTRRMHACRRSTTTMTPSSRLRASG